MERLVKVFFIVLAGLLFVSRAAAAPVIFFGEDLGLGEATRLTSHPNSDAARAAFLGQVSGVVTETLEGFANGTAAPLVVNFGASGTATLLGTGSISTVVSGTNGVGRYPISGNNYWESSSSFSITFSQPQAAFGFYGVDVGDFNGRLTVTYANGTSQTITIPHTVSGTGGTVIYFAFIDTASPFISVTFGNTASGTDFFGFDDFTIGTPQQVVAAGPVRVPTLSAPVMVLLVGIVLLLGAWRLRRSRHSH